MDLVILDSRQVRDLLNRSACLDLLEKAMPVALREEAIQPVRSIMDLPGGAAWGPMPGYIPEPDRAGVRVTALFPDTDGTKFRSQQGAVLLFETAHGGPWGSSTAEKSPPSAPPRRASRQPAIGPDKSRRRWHCPAMGNQRNHTWMRSPKYAIFAMSSSAADRPIERRHVSAGTPGAIRISTSRSRRAPTRPSRARTSFAP